MALAAHLLAPLTRRFQLVLAAIGETSSPKLARMWEQLPAYDEANIEEFARKASPVMNSAKFAAVRQAAGYYALAAGVRPVGVKPDDVPTDFDPRDPFISYWNALKGGVPFEAAVLAGLGRTDALVRDFVVSSARKTGDVVAERSGREVIGWKRVPNPGACPWCIDHAGGLYATAADADYGHTRCNCAAVEIFA